MKSLSRRVSHHGDSPTRSAPCAPIAHVINKCCVEFPAALGRLCWQVNASKPKIDQVVHVSSHLGARIPKASHHEVRPPGGVAGRHSSALSFWLVDKRQSCCDQFWFIHRTAAVSHLMKSVLPSKVVGIVWSRRCRKMPHAFSIALKS